jgi:hypothetical protein
MLHLKLQKMLEGENSKQKFWGLLIICVLLYIGMIAGISFVPKKKENSNEWDKPALVGWGVMVLMLMLSTWIMVMMNPYGCNMNIVDGAYASMVDSGSSAVSSDHSTTDHSTTSTAADRPQWEFTS